MSFPSRAAGIFASLLFLLAFAPGCALDPTPTESQEEVETSWAELSKSQTLLTASQYKRLEDDLTKAIATTKVEIEDLKKKITATEADQKAALAEMETLLAQIRARRAELESNRNTATTGGIVAGIFGFILGGPIGMVLGAGAVGAGAYAIDADSQLKSLDSSLRSAESRKQAATASLNAYTAKKTALEAHLADLQTKETATKQVLAKSAKSAKASASDLFDKYPTVPKRARRAHLLGELLQNLVEQRTTLGEILKLAQAANAQLSAAVTDLEKLRDEADDMVEKSRADLFKILAVMTAANPMAAATAWLEASIAARAKEALAELEIPIVDFALFLVDVWDKGRSLAANPTAAIKDALVKKVTDAVNNAAGVPDWSAVKYTEKQLLALAFAES